MRQVQAGRGRERASETNTHAGAHTNDKHAQGDEIKILGRRLGGWDVAIGGLGLVIVRRDSGLRGRLGRHSGGRVLLRARTQRVLRMHDAMHGRRW